MDQNQSKVDTSTVGNETNPAKTVADGKGKGRAVDITPRDVSMGEEDSSSDEETGAEDEVRFSQHRHILRLTNYGHRQKKSVRSIINLPSTNIRPANTKIMRLTAEEDDDDNMEEIDTDNIIQDGRRTRGKSIDFAKAAENAGDELDDDDDEEDDDFEEKEEDAMHE